MNVSLMRKIDFWVGVPACFILTVLRKIVNLISRNWRPAPSSDERVLFIELSEMGSVILAYSALLETADRVGYQNVYFLIFSENAEGVSLVRLLPEQNVITIDSSSFTKFSISTFKALMYVWHLRVTIVFDLELFSRFTSLFSIMTGAPTRVGFYNYTEEGLYRGNLFTHNVKYNPHHHISANFMALVRSLEADTADPPLFKGNVLSDMQGLPFFPVGEEEQYQIWGKLQKQFADIQDNKKLIVVNADPGLFIPVRGWPIGHYIELIEKIIGRFPEACIVLIGLSGCRVNETIMQAVKSPRCIDFSGQTKNLKELMVLYSIAKVQITNDSGPAHFASLLPIDNYVFFGPETPNLYKPVGENVTTFYSNYSCSPCVTAFNHRDTRCANNRCLQSISAESVFSVLDQRLKEL